MYQYTQTESKVGHVVTLLVLKINLHAQLNDWLNSIFIDCAKLTSDMILKIAIFCKLIPKSTKEIPVTENNAITYMQLWCS